MHTVLGAEFGVVLGVVFAYHHASFVFFCEFVDYGSHCHARTAPCCPEVDYYGLA